MMQVEEGIVEGVRGASRQMVQALGFLAPTLAGTPYGASAVHLLLALAQSGPLNGHQLGQRLGLEKSSVSRLVHRLRLAGELVQKVQAVDGRIKLWTLSSQGEATVVGIHAYGRQQVQQALSGLPVLEQRLIQQGLSRYAQALQGQKEAAEVAPFMTIKTGYQPGLIGQVVALQALYYAQTVGFGAVFERQLSTHITEFSERLQRPKNQMWTVHQGQKIVGSVAIDGEDLGEHRAHLRWFVMAEHTRGLGLGRQLLEQAIQFCADQGLTEIHLWTFQGLGAARHLYESLGFVLRTEAPGAQWGATVVEQHFVRVADGEAAAAGF